MQIIKGISIALVGFSFFGCEFVDTKKVSNEEIKLASNWSDHDQPPSFEQCDNFLELNDQKKCFENYLLKLISSSLSLLKFESMESFDSEITVIIKVDESGLFSVIKFYDSDDVLKKIKYLEKQIINIINNLPRALPAIKTNVGSYVNVKFAIPIKIKSGTKE